jgi:hypothetical protein
MYYRPNAGTAYISCLPEKADRENMEKPLHTVNLKAAQRSSSTGLRDEKRGLEGSWLAWKLALSCHSNTFRHHSAFSKNKSHCQRKPPRKGKED